MNPPPRVHTLKAKLNFSLKWGMWPAAETVPQSGQKISPPSGPVGVVSERGCGYSTAMSCKWIHKNPQWQLSFCPAKHAGQGDQRKSSHQMVNSSLASPSVSHTGPSCGTRSVKEECWIWWCLLLGLSSKPLLSRENRKEFTLDLWIYEINRSPYWEASPELTTFPNSWEVSVWCLHISHATEQPHLHHDLG